MKRLLMLTAVALVALALTGCGRSWSSWFCRGEECDTCSSPPVYSGYGYAGEFAPPPATLPEPLP